MSEIFSNLDYTVYTLALMTGFFGSGHCAGMCGALVAGFFMKTEKKVSGPTLPIILHASPCISSSALLRPCLGCTSLNRHPGPYSRVFTSRYRLFRNYPGSGYRGTFSLAVLHEIYAYQGAE